MKKKFGSSIVAIPYFDNASKPSPPESHAYSVRLSSLFQSHSSTTKSVLDFLLALDCPLLTKLHSTRFPISTLTYRTNTKWPHGHTSTSYSPLTFPFVIGVALPGTPVIVQWACIWNPRFYRRMVIRVTVTWSKHWDPFSEERFEVKGVEILPLYFWHAPLYNEWTVTIYYLWVICHQ